MADVQEIRTRTYRHKDLVGRIPTIVRRHGFTWQFNRFEEVPCHGMSKRTEAQKAEIAAPYCGSENTQAVPVRYAPIYIRI